MGKKSRKKREIRINPPSRYASIMNAVSERDRTFFEAHPDESHYVRQYIPGEFPPDTVRKVGLTLPPQDSWVLVTQMMPGFRQREVLNLPGGADFRRIPDDHIIFGRPETEELIRAYIWKG